MAEQLPEGTDSIIEGAGTSGENIDAEIYEADDHEAVGTTAGTSGVGGMGKDGASASGAGDAMKPAGAWFDKIEEFKAQGFDSARSYAVSGKERATGALDELIRTVSDAADQIDAKVGASYGDYARRAVDGLGSFNDSLKGKDVDELFAEARALIAKAPAVAVGTAAALGFVVARLARAGLPEEDGAGAKPATKTKSGA